VFNFFVCLRCTCYFVYDNNNKKICNVHSQALSRNRRCRAGIGGDFSFSVVSTSAVDCLERLVSKIPVMYGVVSLSSIVTDCDRCVLHS